MSGGARRAAALNGICPYFTMFPLSFPLGVLAGGAEPGDVVLDPFCGRGTTNYASRALGLASFGVDSSPVAVALSQAKLANGVRRDPACLRTLMGDRRALGDLLAQPRPSTTCGPGVIVGGFSEGGRL